MLNNQQFYFSTIRNAIVAFGALFNNIRIDRTDKTGKAVQTLKIPLTYGPKSKALARVMSQPDLENRPFTMALPVISFQITGFDYDSSRKLPPLNQSRSPNTSATAKTQYMPAPYDMQIQMSIYAKYQEDALRIVEQILPYFNPSYVVTLKEVPELNVKRDMSIHLVGINYSDNYEGPVQDDRYILWELAFNLKLNFYGPVTNTALIKEVMVNTHTSMDPASPTDTYKVSVNPLTANETDNWTFLEEFTHSQ